MGPEQDRPVEFDWREENDNFMSWAIISEKNEESIWQKGQTSWIQRRRPRAQEDHVFHIDSRGKWTPNFEGPYVVKKAFSGGALILETMDGEEFPRPMNADAVKKYFA